MHIQQDCPAPPPTPPRSPSSLRFLIPGDIFTALCVSIYRLSDTLLALSRKVSGEPGLSEEARVEYKAALAVLWAGVDEHQIILKAILDEGELPPCPTSTK